MDDQNKNLILAVVLSGIVMVIWLTFFSPQPVTPTGEQATATATPTDAASAPPAPAETAAAPATATDSVVAELAAAGRVTVDTPRLTGSISLLGGRIDTLALKDYRETLDPQSALVNLLTPVGTPKAYYAVYGWSPAGDLPADEVPTATTLYTVESGSTLTPDSPVTLRWDNGHGLIFRRTVSVDGNYMFTIDQSVENTGTAPARLAAYGIVARHGQPDSKSYYVLHEGVVRQSDSNLEEIKYKDMTKLTVDPHEGGGAELKDVAANGWVGFTDKYWMTTLIPSPGSAFTSVVKYVPSADIFQVEARMPVQEVAPGQKIDSTQMLFAGAKEWETIRAYENQGGIYHFIDSIDWGWFFFITKPMFWVLHWLHGAIGNMGWSIIALTFVVKAIMFPLAYRSYVSMAKMKELQPEMEAMKARVGDDRQKMQQETMALYKKNKVNPASGCLPLLLQIPVFFSLYKVIFVTIELRHAAWVGWIHDLSSPDPTSILNLFGLLPIAAPGLDSPLHIISLGVLPILLGISMWLQQKLNPAPTDPAQAAIFTWMPWIFMFMLGTFPSGLVLYWIANNTLTFTQQYTIMSIHGKAPDLFGNILASVPGTRANKARKDLQKSIKPLPRK